MTSPHSFFLLAFIGSAFAVAPPAEVVIAAAFPMFNSDGSLNADGAQYQAAYLMAVAEINNKADGIFDSLLPNTQIKTAVVYADTTATAAKAAKTLFSTSINGKEVSFLINALSPQPGGFLNSIWSGQGPIAQATPLSADTARDGDVDVMLAPSSELIATVTADLICDHFEYSRIAIIREDNDFSWKNVAALRDYNPCGIDILFETSVATLDAIIQLAENRPRVFVIFTETGEALGAVLQSLYDFRIISRTEQIIGVTPSGTTSVSIADGISVEDTVPDILTGMVTARFDAHRNYNAGFMTRFKAQSSTARASGSCLTTKDDAAATYLFRNEAGDVCTGLDFSTFQTRADYAEFVAHVYDSVIMAVVALHELLVVNGGSSSSATINLITAGLSALSYTAGMLAHLRLYLCLFSCAYIYMLLLLCLHLNSYLCSYLC